MITLEGYREFYRSSEARAKKRADGEVARERHGCCDVTGCNRYVIDVDTYGEAGQFISRRSEVKCHLTGRSCPAGELREIIGRYGMINAYREGIENGE